ncbi:MAG: hypothetical protein ACFFCS_02110 [Candidatus Hodarchaeota archaeon]
MNYVDYIHVVPSSKPISFVERSQVEKDVQARAFMPTGKQIVDILKCYLDHDIIKNVKSHAEISGELINEGVDWWIGEFTSSGLYIVKWTWEIYSNFRLHLWISDSFKKFLKKYINVEYSFDLSIIIARDGYSPDADSMINTHLFKTILLAIGFDHMGDSGILYTHEPILKAIHGRYKPFLDDLGNIINFYPALCYDFNIE